MQVLKKRMIAWKPLGDSDVASSRLRAFIPCTLLSEAGWPCEIFNPANIDRYAAVIFQKVYDGENFYFAEKLNKRGVKTVFDLCDNHFYNPENTFELQQRSEKLRKMIDAVDAVSVSTRELAKLIPFRETFLIDDAVDLLPENRDIDRYYAWKEKLNLVSRHHLKIVWYGNAGLTNPPFGIIDIQKIISVLNKVHIEFPLILTIISNSKKQCLPYLHDAIFPVRYCKWKQSTFRSLFTRNDICIIPVSRNPFTVCKTNNRVVLSLMLGVPVIADRIPSYEEFSDYVLFSDWENNLRKYIIDKTLRERHAELGKRYILDTYNKDRVLNQWGTLFQRLLGEDLDINRKDFAGQCHE